MQDHKTRQTARIVEAALTVIHAEGMSRVSISKVAAEAGVTRQTVYNYFPDVESIVARVMDEHSAAMEQQLVAIIEQADGAFETLHAFAAFQISNATPEHAVPDLEVGLSAESRARVAAHTETVKGALEQAIVSGIEEGVLDDRLVPAVATDLLWGMLEGAVDAAVKHPDQKPFLLGAVVNAMWAAVASSGRPHDRS